MKDNRLHILIIDDNPKDYTSFRAHYGDRHNLVFKNSPDAGIAEAGRPNWDIILVDLDYGQGYEEGLEEILPRVLDQVKNRCPVLVVTSDTRKETQQLALGTGASGMVLKAEWYDELLLVRIHEVIKNHQDKVTVAIPRESPGLVEPDNKHTPKELLNFISVSPALQQLKTQLETAVNYPNVPVLILGETGVGKEVAARYLHYAKGDPNAPLEILNLSALNKDTIASELFGHKKGAFTGANADKAGYFERAGSGVLFLDEIGELSHDIQVQLLRALENRTFQRVGDTRERKLNAHLVFATNKNLEDAVSSGEIREDFYQRITALIFTIPPLRERPEDLLPLTEHFYETNLHPNHPLSGKDVQSAFTGDALVRLYDYTWPGNVRELRNTIQRLLFDAELKKKQYIDLDLLPDRLIKTVRANFQAEANSDNSRASSPKSPAEWGTDKLSAYAELKRIEEALIKEGGRKLEAAQRLGLKNDQTLRYRVQSKYFEKYPDLFEEFQTIKKVYKLT